MSPRHRRRILAVAIGAIALDTALLGLIAPLLPEIERRTGASEAELGLALGAYALPILLVSLPLGRAADAIGRRPLLLSGLLLTAAGSVLIAVAGSLPPLIVGRSIQGVGSAASWIAALALVSDLAPPDRKGEAIGFALAANSVGAIGGPALGGISGDAIGFEFPFLFVAGIAVGLAVAGRVVLPRQQRRAGGGPRTSVPDLIRLAASGPVLPAILSVIVGAVTLGVIDVVAPLDADERLGLTAAAIGGLFAATLALDAAAAPIAGRWSDRIGRVQVALLGLSLLAISLVLLAVLPGIGGFVVGLSVFGIGSSVMFASAVPWLAEAFGDLDKGFGYGFLNLIYSIGYAAGPIAAGVGLQSSGADLTYVLTAVLIVAAAVLMFLRRAAMPD
ncbi:MAG: MFS transporter [Solirubrobacterales bacterium]|nr:MAG: MFS transporter [Solirubrobacterales bacterium]